MNDAIMWILMGITAIGGYRCIVQGLLEMQQQERERKQRAHAYRVATRKRVLAANAKNRKMALEND